MIYDQDSQNQLVTYQFRPFKGKKQQRMINFIHIFATIILYGFSFYSHVHAEPFEDKQALLEFISNTQSSSFLNWDPSTPTCTTWNGVTCNIDQTHVTALRLPGVGLRGLIPPNTLSRLMALQTLSLRNNDISGPFPSDFSKLGNLSHLYLQYNRFSGSLPSGFSVWTNLEVLGLSNNNFNGSIPPSISNLTHLTELDLSSNSLSGEIPANIGLLNLKSLNLSNNDLTGTLPSSLKRFPSSAFSGNNFTNEVSLPPVPLVPSRSTDTFYKSNRSGDRAFLGILIGACLFGFLMVVVITLLYCSAKWDQGKGSKSSKMKRAPTESQEEKSGTMTFFRGSNLAFDLEDLLRASAEVLGKGLFGMTYKASLEDSTTVVVKRLKEVSVGKHEFQQHMEVIGNIKHENVVPLIAYYYSQDEQLMVYDYYNGGSLSNILHGKMGENRTPVDWETRLRIAVGAARGIAHIHNQNSGRLIHGNIKSSNIFLNTKSDGCVSDHGLATIATPKAATNPTPQIQYRAPKVSNIRQPSQASDVYSFGVVLLELLTGKSPVGVGPGEEDQDMELDLVKWVTSVVQEEWTAEVFDEMLLKCPNIEEDMVTMLQLGMACVNKVPETRPQMREVVSMLEDIQHFSVDALAT